MVPLVYTPEDAARAVSYCKFAPQGTRSVCYPVRAAYGHGRGAAPGALRRYLKDANSETEVWVQVETKECLEAIDDVLAVPGISCAFLGECFGWGGARARTGTLSEGFRARRRG
jgi:2-keto-3-deoxy-L-rhamnonate aldolase RhmA